jgi:AcrR family transcriptional regulator
VTPPKRPRDAGNEADERSPRGRPRDPQVDASILAAAERELRRRGFAGMSVQRVATEARVGKAAIYRRYRDKTDLAVAAITAIRDTGVLPSTGDARADLVERLRRLRAALDTAGMSMIGTLLVEEERTPELLERFRARSIHPGRQGGREILEAARERGELRDDADLELALDMLVGSLFARHLVGAPFPADWEEQVVAAIWRSIAA